MTTPPNQNPYPSSTRQLLPASAFTDRSVLDAEQKAIFENSWVNIGYGGEIPKAGDVKTLRLFGLPLLITRDKDGAAHVFHNVCRHRGHLLVTTERATGPVITCPYHAWSYELNGKFRAAPCWGGADGAQPDQSTKSSFALTVVRSVVWCDMIFVNLSGTAPAFQQFIAPLAARWRPYDLHQFELAELRAYTAEGNWKLAIENFLDAYHFPCVHRQFGTYAVMRKSEPLRISPDIFGYHMPTGEADKPKTGAPLPQLTLPDHLRPAQDILYIFPNTLVILTATWLQIINLMPRACDATDESFAIYLVRSAASNPEVQTTREDFIKAANLINEQDMPVLRNLQAGMNSPVASEGTYVQYWDANPYYFHQRLRTSLDYQPSG